MKKLHILVFLLALPFCGFGCVNKNTSTTLSTPSNNKATEEMQTFKTAIIRKTLFSIPAAGDIILETTTVIGEPCLAVGDPLGRNLCRLCKFHMREDGNCIVSEFYFTNSSGEYWKIFESGTDVLFQSTTGSPKVSFSYSDIYEGSGGDVIKYFDLSTRESLLVSLDFSFPSIQLILEQNNKRISEYDIGFPSTPCVNTSSVHYVNSVSINDNLVKIEPIEFYCVEGYGTDLIDGLIVTKLSPDYLNESVSFSLVNSKNEVRNFIFNLNQGSLIQSNSEAALKN